MLKGDLSSTTLASVMLDLAADNSTGSLSLRHPGGEEAQIFMRSGLICGIHAPERRSDLGAKLVSSGILAPEALADALEAQRTDLSAWNLGELLVHLGYVDEAVVQEFVTEQLHEALWDLMRWTEGTWRFRKNAKTREDVGPPVTVIELLESLRERGYEWESIADIVHSPNAIPVLSASGDGAPETTLGSDAWSMLCKIDGMRSVAQLADDCGYTLFEAGQVLVELVDAGLVEIAADSADDDDTVDVYGAASALAGALGGRTPPAPNGAATNGAANGNATSGGDALSRLARLATDVATHAGSNAATTNPLQLDVMAAQLSGGANLTVPVSRRSGESFAAAMDRVAGTLADALGPPPEHSGDLDSLVTVRKKARAVPRTDEEDPDEAEKRRRRRAAAAAELAAAQAAAESLRPDHDVNARADAIGAPRLVDLEAERARVAAREAEEAARHATEGAAREAAERFAREAAEQARLAQELADRAQREAEDLEATRREAAQTPSDEEVELGRLAQAAEQSQREAAEKAAEEAARLAAEQAAAEEAARQAAQEAARLATERAAAEEAARLAAEQAAAEEAARVAAEQAAAEQAAVEQAAVEQAAAEAARLAEAQAAAEEAERLAAEEAERQAAAAEAERQAAEQAAAEEAERQAAAEEAERQAAAEAERQAAEQAAAEEAERQAAAEAERVEQEATARAALAAAQAAADRAAEAARIAQEQAVAEEARATAEEAERTALEEALASSQRADEAAAATAMLVELHNSETETFEPADDLPPEPEPEPELDPLPASASGDTDTAALLRELSSLGLDDGPPTLASATPPPRPRPQNGANEKKAKKKIGLFGL